MRVTCFTALFSAFLSWGCFSSAWGQDSFENLLREGRAAYLGADVRSAEEYYRKACPADLLSSFPPNKLAACEHHMAVVDEAQGRNEIAEQRYLRSLRAWERCEPGVRAAHVTTLMNLGEFYRQRRRFADSERILLHSVELARTGEKDTPHQIPETLSRLGGLYGNTQDPERGRAPLLEAIAGFGKLATPEPAELAYARNALGMIDLYAGRREAAEANLRDAVRLATASLGEDHPETAVYQTNLALALILRGQPERAEPLLRRARFIIETRAGPSDKRLGVVFAEMAGAALGQNRFAIAEDCARQALALLTRQPESDPLAVALANVNLASIYLRERKWDEAEKILPDAVAEERRALENRGVLADGIRHLAELRAAQRAWPEADELYREAIGLYESKLGPENPEIAPVLRAYAEVRKHNGASKGEVKTLETRAKTISGFMSPD
jgi:tetratricopeptide (TPR) repeat protein